jgi:hypothetical protein
VALLLYAPEILNRSIEQEYHDMPRARTPQEEEFLKYFRRIDKSAINEILSQYRSTGPEGYATSLVLTRILKVKERISSDRELSDKLAKIRMYRKAIGISRHDIPAHNTSHTLRQRLGPKGFFSACDVEISAVLIEVVFSGSCALKGRGARCRYCHPELR